MKTKKEVHQKLTELLEPYLFEKELSPKIKEEIEQALLPLECKVTPIAPKSRLLEMFYRFPTDETCTFRRVEVLVTPNNIQIDNT